jgi:hypothetical protein
LRTALPQVTALSAAERTLLDEWLVRITDDRPSAPGTGG